MRVDLRLGVEMVSNRAIVKVFIVCLNFVSSFAVALPTSLDCESESGELIGCVSLPSDSPFKSRAEQPKIIDSRPTNRISLLTRDELNGREIAPAKMLVTSAHGKINPAMLAAVEAQNQLQRVELFLKTGPASSGDLRTIEIGKPSKPRN